eukprot:6172230-Pleurochrysis_carterae.AAC.1
MRNGSTLHSTLSTLALVSSMVAVLASAMTLSRFCSAPPHHPGNAHVQGALYEGGQQDDVLGT